MATAHDGTRISSADMDAPSWIPPLLRCAVAALVAVVLWLPPWWAAGRPPEAFASPFLPLLVAAVGALAVGALVGWLGVVNLQGRQLEHSRAAAWICLGLNAGAAAWLLSLPLAVPGALIPSTDLLP